MAIVPKGDVWLPGKVAQHWSVITKPQLQDEGISFVRDRTISREKTGRLTLIDQVCFLVLCVEVIIDDQHRIPARSTVCYVR